MDALENTITNLRLQLKSLMVMAGIVEAVEVGPTEFTGTVATVYDGDTIVVRVHAVVEARKALPPPFDDWAKVFDYVIVRLVGIDAPELVGPAGYSSQRYLAKLVLGKEVLIKTDPAHLEDQYGRRLGVVFCEGKNINLEMLKWFCQILFARTQCLG